MIKNHFKTSSHTKLSDGTRECKKGCDAEDSCKFAALNWMDGAKKCDLYGMECKSNMMDMSGYHLYEKQTKRVKREAQTKGRCNFLCRLKYRPLYTYIEM